MDQKSIKQLRKIQLKQINDDNLMKLRQDGERKSWKKPFV